MSTYTRIIYQIVFSTKYRERTLIKSAYSFENSVNGGGLIFFAVFVLLLGKYGFKE